MSEMKQLKKIVQDGFEQMSRQFENVNKRLDSHENMILQLMNLVSETNQKLANIRNDVEFVFKDNALVKLELDRLKRN